MVVNIGFVSGNIENVMIALELFFCPLILIINLPVGLMDEQGKFIEINSIG